MDGSKRIWLRHQAYLCQPFSVWRNLVLSAVRLQMQSALEPPLKAPVSSSSPLAATRERAGRACGCGAGNRNGRTARAKRRTWCSKDGKGAIGNDCAHNTFSRSCRRSGLINRKDRCLGSGRSNPVRRWNRFPPLLEIKATDLNRHPGRRWITLRRSAPQILELKAAKLTYPKRGRSGLEILSPEKTGPM